MVQWHLKSKRKKTGGKRKSLARCSKKLAWRGRDPTLTIVADKDVRVNIRVRGGNYKTVLKKASTAAVVDPETNKIYKAKIRKVLENIANREYARRNIITKGAIIEVMLKDKPQKVKVTSRPSQHGIVQGILLK